MATVTDPQSTTREKRTAVLHGRPLLKPLRRRVFFAALGALLIVAAIIYAVQDSGDQEFATDDLTVETVRLERFLRRISAQGEVRTYMPTIIYNDCRWWDRKIIELIPEGSHVEPGDIVCRLDSSELEEKLKEQQVHLIRTQAGLANATMRESLQKSENARAESRAQLRATVTEDLRQAFIEAESPDTLRSLTGQLKISEERLQQNADEFQHSRKLTAMGALSTSGLQLAESRFQRAIREARRAQGELTLTERFQVPRTVLDRTRTAEEARRNLFRIQLQSELLLANARVNRLNLQQNELKIKEFINYLERAIAACTMRAPRSGEVIYCHQRDKRRFIEVGAHAHYMQELIRISDRSRLTVAGRVSDVHVYDVNPGDPVEIRVSNLPDETFHGTLDWVAPIPSRGEWYQPDSLHHKVGIMIDEPPERLQMLTLASTVDADIIVDDRNDVVQCPIKAVFELDGEKYVIVREQNGKLRVQSVQLGQKNHAVVEVIDGLSGGEDVVIDNRYSLKERARRMLSSSNN